MSRFFRVLRRHRVFLLFALFILAISYHFIIARTDYSIVPDKFIYGLQKDKASPAAAGSAQSSDNEVEQTPEQTAIDDNDTAEKTAKESTVISDSTGSDPEKSDSAESAEADVKVSAESSAETSARPQPGEPLTAKIYEDTFPPDDFYHGSASHPLPPGTKQIVGEDLLSRPRIVKYPVTNAALLSEDPPLNLAKVQGIFTTETDEERAKREERLSAVKDAFKHSWQGYKKYAWGHDEIQPISHRPADTFGGLGASIIDAIDTLQIMDLSDEFEEAKQFVANMTFSGPKIKTIPVFETTIRYLGGLVAAYDLSSPRDDVFLQKAVELADLLIGAFDTPNGMPVLYYDPELAHRESKLRAGKHAVFAQFASLSLEFTRLAQITGNNTYYAVIQRVTDHMEDFTKTAEIPGLWPDIADISGCVTESDLLPESETSGASDASGTSEDAKEKSSQTSAASAEFVSAALQAITAARESHDSSGAKLRKRQDSDSESSSVPGSELAEAVSKSTISLASASSPQINLDELSTIKASKVEKCVDVQGIVGNPKRGSHPKFPAGGLVDSAYEYLIKEYILLGGTKEQYKRMYTTSKKAIQENLLYRPKVEGDPDILFAGNLIMPQPGRKEFDAEMTHLSCYLGGMFALGAQALEIPADLVIAEKLAEGCVWAYRATNTGIMPENFHVDRCTSPDDCHWVDPPFTPKRTSSTSQKLRKRQESAEEQPAQESSSETAETISDADQPAPEAHSEEPTSSDGEKSDEQSSEPESAAANEQTTEQEAEEPSYPEVKESLESMEKNEETIESAGSGAGDGDGEGVKLVGAAEESSSESTEVEAEGSSESTNDNTDLSNDNEESQFSDLAEKKSSDSAESETKVGVTTDNAETLGEATEHVEESSAESSDDSSKPEDTAGEPVNEAEATENTDEPSTENAAIESKTDTSSGETINDDSSEGKSVSEDSSDAVEVNAENKEVLMGDDHSSKDTDSSFIEPILEEKSEASPESEAGTSDNSDAAKDDSTEVVNESPADAHPGVETSLAAAAELERSKSNHNTVPLAAYEADAPDAPAEDDPDRWEVGGWYDQPRSILYQDGRYLLRPEALESIFVLYRVTGDRKWQERGWEIFSAIIKYTKTDTAFSAIRDVTNNRKITYLDEMESFWMAETLKYAYLLLADPSLISLDDYVFNTEAHPFLRPSPVQNAPE
ncbi:glycosyl hydrolase family 47-domain-containing protein [Kockiozyma suomiensis]|uniref:glycosyl hydrolase family 47-domain-containing protein n=1 Tax=Kockiozyma suomiensis TaxID=1337062 RepID=UPI0033442E7E